ncbi:MAG: hypothetical protein HY079_02725 [Elusimicrobia bacterium]|nr:hypothetical protein [Elusimicrobiota bacterium]
MRTLPRALALAALLSPLAGPARADDVPMVDLRALKKAAADVPAPAGAPELPANPSCAARGYPTAGECRPDSAERFCDGTASCERFCCCSMAYDHSKWSGVYDWRTTNVKAPVDIRGTLKPDAAELTDLSASLSGARVLTDLRGKRSTRAVADGLSRLDAALDADPERATLRYTVSVRNCYRRAIGNTLEPRAPVPDANAEAVCGELFTMMHFEDLPVRTEIQEKVLAGLHSGAPHAFLMAWPGSTPHAAGDACDLVLKDARGQDCFDARAGTPDSPHCSIDQRKAVAILSHAVARAGGARLDYEAWHFEWGGKTGAGSCRCQGEACDPIWPVTTAAGCP